MAPISRNISETACLVSLSKLFPFWTWMGDLLFLALGHRNWIWVSLGGVGLALVTSMALSHPMNLTGHLEAKSKLSALCHGPQAIPGCCSWSQGSTYTSEWILLLGMVLPGGGVLGLQ